MAKVADLDQKDMFIEMRSKGITYERIAKELHVSKPTLIKWGKEFQLDIENRKAMEIEYLQEKYFVSWKKRMELIGNMAVELDDEIKKRDLSDVATEKLIEMQIKIMDKLKGEEKEILFKEKESLRESIDRIDETVTTWQA